jgi:hypothetical protein
MIPGLNSNITHDGVEYHVQTEDLGRENPYLLTLVFRAGAIIAREKVNYLEALGEGATEAGIKGFMAEQHQRAIQTILAGPSQASAPPPAPGASATAKPSLPPADKTLDQLIAEYLRRRNAGKGR